MSVVEPFAIAPFLAPVFGVCWPLSVLFDFVRVASFDVTEPTFWVHHIRAHGTLDLLGLGRCLSFAGGEMTGLISHVIATFGALLTFVQVTFIFGPPFASSTFFFPFSSGSNDLRVVIAQFFILTGCLLFSRSLFLLSL